ncbi:MAG: PASTA domain-containing protein [Clostridiaceae bacterium]|nr:PASTA domain-containing protein [Clostridiaceae bacterium]
MKGGTHISRINNTRRSSASSDKLRKSGRSKADALGKPNTTRYKKREFVLLLFFTLSLLLLIYKVAEIQFVKGEKYREMAYLNQTQKRQINPKRGTIYDRNGKGLAISASVDTVGVNPKALRDELKGDETKLRTLANDLATMLGMDSETIMAKFNKNSRYEFIKRKIEREIGTQVRAYLSEKKITNIYVDEDSKRYYPNGKLASHVLGFTGIDDQGLSGIELELDNTLKGVPGKIMNEVDVLGRQISYSQERYIDAIDGYNVYLTIDETIQHFAEKTLQQAVLDYNLKNGGMVIVMNPKTGEVLAMASYPDFDPNDPGGKPDFIDDPDWGGFSDEEDSKLLWQTVFRNKAVMDTYEPGSVFKAITAAAAIEEGVVTPTTPEYCKPISIAGHTINCWRSGGHGAENFTEAVYNSCNPVFVKTALDLGIEKFYKYVRLFGFQEKTGIELQGEPSSEEFKRLWHSDPKEIDLAVSSFGQRFQISPLQMITAYSAIANGGNLLKPTIIKQITDNDGNIIKKFEPQVIRKVISEETSKTIRTILEGVVKEGTGKNAYISGYRIGGKTGTSETLTTDSDGRYIVSFMSFAPADDPQVCVLVALDFPQVPMHLRSGGILAAPVAGKLTEEILEYLRVERQYTDKDKSEMTQEVYVPNVTGLTLKEAEEKLSAFGLKYIVEGTNQSENAIVYNQTPKADFSVPQSATVILYTDENHEEMTVQMPDLTNKSVDEATATLKQLGLNIRIRGTGKVQKQQYEPGTKLRKGDVVEVTFVETEVD